MIQGILTILIPCYNERKTLLEVLKRIHAVDLPLTKEIILINDASTDWSPQEMEIAVQDHVNIIIHHKTNQGKGMAIQTGLVAATGDFLLIQDADLEYSPTDYPRLLEPLLEGKADVVYGSRFVSDRPHRLLYFWHYVGNVALTLLTNIVTNLNLSDMETCYKVLSKPFYTQLRLTEKRFGIEPEITIKLAKAKARFYEVGIAYDGRTYEEGKKIGWKDGVQAIVVILKHTLFKNESKTIVTTMTD